MGCALTLYQGSESTHCEVGKGIVTAFVSVHASSFRSYRHETRDRRSRAIRMALYFWTHSRAGRPAGSLCYRLPEVLRDHRQLASVGRLTFLDATIVGWSSFRPWSTLSHSCDQSGRNSRHAEMAPPRPRSPGEANR
jgi:hypothetical protein